MTETQHVPPAVAIRLARLEAAAAAAHAVAQAAVNVAAQARADYDGESLAVRAWLGLPPDVEFGLDFATGAVTVSENGRAH